MEGNPKVEQFMEPVSEAIHRHVAWTDPWGTEIYNRAYEAVDAAVKAREREIVEWLKADSHTIGLDYSNIRRLEVWLAGR